MWCYVILGSLVEGHYSVTYSVFQRLLSKGFTHTKNVLMRRDYEMRQNAKSSNIRDIPEKS